jgi:hypothetical protein
MSQRVTPFVLLGAVFFVTLGGCGADDDDGCPDCREFTGGTFTFPPGVMTSNGGGPEPSGGSTSTGGLGGSVTGGLGGTFGGGTAGLGGTFGGGTGGLDATGGDIGTGGIAASGGTFGGGTAGTLGGSLGD